MIIKHGIEIHENKNRFKKLLFDRNGELKP